MGRSLRETLQARATLVDAVRGFFHSRGFLEVSTPVALPYPNLDPNVRPVPVDISDFQGRRHRHWLHTSPELAMKKLLARGSGSVFQVASVFRDGEVTPLHRPEFTMLEWYRLGGSCDQAIEDTVELARTACRAVSGRETATWGGREIDLAGPWERLTMAEAFQRWAGIGAVTATEMALALMARGYRGLEQETAQGLFHRLYLEAVEPNLGKERPVVVRDFPSFLGTMARPRPGRPDVLDRFEAFVGGVELANGFTELSDRAELAIRLEGARQGLEHEGVEGLEVDREFLEAMERLPPCAGVSVGLDRLLMLALGEEDIARVVYPYTD